MYICLRLIFCQFCVVIRFFSSPSQRPITSDFKGFLHQILSFTLFSYLNSSLPLILFQRYTMLCNMDGMLTLQQRTAHLRLMQMYLENADYAEHQHRAEELKTCLERMADEEEETGDDKHIAKYIITQLKVFS